MASWVRMSSWMRSRGAHASVVATLLLAAAPALAQDVPPAVPAAPKPADPAQPETRHRAEQRLNLLFERLREAPDAQNARGIANEIEQILERSGSPTADLVYQRAKEAVGAKDLDLALDLLDFVLAMKPDWAEAHHRRAVVHFLRKDEEAALRDVRAALALEPRHYQALAGLGGLLRGMGNRKGAYRAFTRALEIYPHFPDLKGSLDKMRPEIEGQPI